MAPDVRRWYNRMLVGRVQHGGRSGEGVVGLSRDEEFRELALGQTAGLRRLAYTVCGE